MSTQVDQSMAADAAAGALTALSAKRSLDSDDGPLSKMMKVDAPQSSDVPLTSAPPTTTSPPATEDSAAVSKSDKSRKIRLEQNRKAAKESRRRKKVMIEELQRSVIFFSRANGTLKQQNEELMRLILRAKSEVAAQESGTKIEVSSPPKTAAETAGPVIKSEELIKAFGQAEADAVAAQAIFKSQGFPTAAARAAAHAVVPSAASPATSGQTAQPPTMQPGATMQAMANFQQAATIAMQNAMKALAKTMPGVPVSQFAAPQPTDGTSAQQAFTDTMTALAMQQAAAAAGQQFMMQQSGMPFLFPMFGWTQPTDTEQKDN
jgi:hypothetical protein